MNTRQRIQAAWRAFKLGPAVVDSWDTWGRITSEYQPEEYAAYLATSNTVYVCANLRADLLASLPLRVYSKKSEIERGPLYDLLRRPNPQWTLGHLVKMTELSLCLWGEAFWFLERGKGVRMPPQEMWWGRADRVDPQRDPVEYVKGFAYQPIGFAKPLEFLPQEVLWLRFPNPLDEFEGLSPLAAARLAADTASAALKSNRAIFEHGLNVGGFLFPKSGTELTQEQAKELEDKLDRRFKGADKAHRMGVFRFEAEFKQPELTPKDAEFLGALRFSQEEIARAYRVPLDLIGGQRTYSNYEAAMKAIWTQCIIPEAHFVEAEINRQLVPMFPGVDYVEFDTAGVEILQEDRTEIVDQMSKLYQMRVPLNVLLNEFMPQLLPDTGGFPWGDEPPAAPAPFMQLPQAAPAEAQPVEEEMPPERKQRAAQTRTIEYGSDEHKRLWGRFVRRADAYEDKTAGMVRNLLERQRDSVLDKLKGQRAVRFAVADLFKVAFWVKEFRDAMHPIMEWIVGNSGKDAMDDLSVSTDFDVKESAVAKFMSAREQRFAERVNDTTWNELKASLIEGMDAGEGIPQLADRVQQVMGDRIRSSPEVIARTEVIGASNGGMLEAWKQSGLVTGKVWLAALDDRTRKGPPEDEFNHLAAHGEEVGIDEPFTSTGEELMFPGDDAGSAGNVIQCRCTMKAVMD